MFLEAITIFNQQGLLNQSSAKELPRIHEIDKFKKDIMNIFNILYHLLTSQNKLNWNNNLTNMMNFFHKSIQSQTTQFRHLNNFHFYKPKLSPTYQVGNQDQSYTTHINVHHIYPTYTKPNDYTSPQPLSFASNYTPTHHCKTNPPHHKLRTHHTQNLASVDYWPPNNHNKHSMPHH